MVAEIIPEKALREGTVVARVWRGSPIDGPSVVTLNASGVFDLTDQAGTMSSLLNQAHAASVVRRTTQGAERICSVTELIENSSPKSRKAPYLLAPCDLQAIKAAGVTFAESTLERVVEEKTRGNSALAAEVREAIIASVGDGFTRVIPGSAAAARLKDKLVGLHLWSQYLEVALGADAEIFTKSAPMSAVGFGAEIGILRQSAWNNPEPEVVLAVNSRGDTVGATLGNDVNLRDLEGRSALLLGKAKDNNASCAIGPAIRLFDDEFGMADVEQEDIAIEMQGPEGFRLSACSSMSQISRAPLELVRQAMGAHHQYPDGMMLFLGTMFAPVEDRAGPGMGFTHRVGDVVTISSPALGSLMNTVNHCESITPWSFGVGSLFAYLQRRGIGVATCDSSMLSSQ
jgi:fumarylacetoacetate (FAA) hydrolase family protein